MGTMCVFYIYSVDEHLEWPAQQMKLLTSAPYMYNSSRNSSPNLKHWTRVEVVDRFHPLNNFCGDCMAQAFEDTSTTAT